MIPKQAMAIANAVDSNEKDSEAVQGEEACLNLSLSVPRRLLIIWIL